LSQADAGALLLQLSTAWPHDMVQYALQVMYTLPEIFPDLTAGHTQARDGAAAAPPVCSHQLCKVQGGEAGRIHVSSTGLCANQGQHHIFCVLYYLHHRNQPPLQMPLNCSCLHSSKLLPCPFLNPGIGNWYDPWITKQGMIKPAPADVLRALRCCALSCAL
jgi:hypothetical protein